MASDEGFDALTHISGNFLNLKEGGKLIRDAGILQRSWIDASEQRKLTSRVFHEV